MKRNFKRLFEDIKRCFETGQPVLVGTTSIETSELLSNELNKANIPHEVLNAKQHEREAQIVAQAGACQIGNHRHQYGGSRHRYRAWRQFGSRIARLG